MEATGKAFHREEAFTFFGRKIIIYHAIINFLWFVVEEGYIFNPIFALFFHRLFIPEAV
jgi:hypothetical protein